MKLVRSLQIVDNFRRINKIDASKVGSLVVEQRDEKNKVVATYNGEAALKKMVRDAKRDAFYNQADAGDEHVYGPAEEEALPVIEWAQIKLNALGFPETKADGRWLPMHREAYDKLMDTRHHTSVRNRDGEIVTMVHLGTVVR